MPKPNFFLIGAPKAGTTSLYHYLKEHPQIYMSPIKEPRYFDRNDRDWADYLALFDNVQHEIAIGEASPQYLFSKDAPERIKSSAPDAKLIMILRQPVDRAYSHYLGYRRRGLELCASFEQAFQESETKWYAGTRIGWQYKLPGYYTPQIENYLRHFDRSHLMICLFDDLVNTPVQLIRQIYCFLAVDPDFLPNLSVSYNVRKYPEQPVKKVWVQLMLSGKVRLPGRWQSCLNKWYQKQGSSLHTPLDTDVWCRLSEVYRPDIQNLQELIDRDLSHWLPDG